MRDFRKGCWNGNNRRLLCYDSEEAKVLKERSAGLFQCKGRQAMEGTGGI